jgi:hypothetical protein
VFPLKINILVPKRKERKCTNDETLRVKDIHPYCSLDELAYKTCTNKVHFISALKYLFTHSVAFTVHFQLCMYILISPLINDRAINFYMLDSQKIHIIKHCHINMCWEVIVHLSFTHSIMHFAQHVLWCLSHSTVLFLVYFLYFEKIKGGLWDHLIVCIPPAFPPFLFHCLCSLCHIKGK